MFSPWHWWLVSHLNQEMIFEIILILLFVHILSKTVRLMEPYKQVFSPYISLSWYWGQLLNFPYLRVLSSLFPHYQLFRMWGTHVLNVQVHTSLISDCVSIRIRCIKPLSNFLNKPIFKFIAIGLLKIQIRSLHKLLWNHTHNLSTDFTNDIWCFSLRIIGDSHDLKISLISSL